MGLRLILTLTLSLTHNPNSNPNHSLNHNIILTLVKCAVVNGFRIFLVLRGLMTIIIKINVRALILARPKHFACKMLWSDTYPVSLWYSL